MSEHSAAPGGRPGPNSAATSTADTVSRVLRASTAASQQGADDRALGFFLFFNDGCCYSRPDGAADGGDIIGRRSPGAV